jgi:Zn-dependent protease
MSTEPDAAESERGHGLRIATVGGVSIYIAPSWLVIALAIVVIVGPPLASERPDLGVLAYAVGALQAVLLLVSVLAHEGAHAAAARMAGLPVVRIVANLWGGHTAVESGRSTPGKMAGVAFAGPLANALLALAAFGATGAVSGDIPGRLVAGFAIVNAALAVFNILPGLPLDGGQLVESVVWRATGNRNAGSIAAGWCGRALTILVVLWFVVRPLARGEGLSISVIWMLLIASVLWTGASHAIARGRVLGRLERVQLAQVLRPAVITPSTVTVAQAVATGREIVLTDAHGLPAAYVAADHLRTVPDGLRAITPVTAVAGQQDPGWVVEADPAGDIVPVIAALQRTRLAVFAVVHGGRLAGVVHASDVNDALSRN